MERSWFAIFFVICGLLSVTNGQKTTAELEAEIAALEAELAVLRSYVATGEPCSICLNVFVNFEVFHFSSSTVQCLAATALFV